MLEQSTTTNDDDDDGVSSMNNKSKRLKSSSPPSKPPPKTPTPPADPHDFIRRFIETHEEHFDIALSEIKRGKKRSCWSWFILPVAPWIVNGIERGSFTNRRYALRTDEQAKEYENYLFFVIIETKVNLLFKLTAI
jgi:hypothetical protein